MANKPFTSSFSSASPIYDSYPVSTFLTSTGTLPTAQTTSYCRYMNQSNKVNIDFKVVFDTVGTGDYRFNLPYPISSNYGKPQGTIQVRYVGTGRVHIGHYNESTSTQINIVFSATWGNQPDPFTSSAPHNLTTGDIISGWIEYEKD